MGTQLANDGRPGPMKEAQVARLDATVGSTRLRLKLKVTPAGLLAIGGLVSGVLLSTAALVWVSTSVAREHPLTTRLKLR